VQIEVKAPGGGLHHNSIVLLNQIRTIDKRRVGRYWGHLSAQTMLQMDETAKISLGLVPSLWTQTSGPAKSRKLL
jgi:mRNA interferase MazF